MNVNNIKLKTKFAVLIVVLFVIALIGSVAWTSYAQREQTINELPRPLAANVGCLGFHVCEPRQV